MRRFRNPRYAPEFLERRLSPSAFVPEPTAEIATANPEPTDPEPSDPVPFPFPSDPSLPPIPFPVPPIGPGVPN